MLSRETVGRLVYVDHAGPAAVPVNYGLGDGDVVFRSEDGSKIEALTGATVAFEVDHIDEADRSGWSVLLRGKAELFDLDRAPELIAQLTSQQASHQALRQGSPVDGVEGCPGGRGSLRSPPG